MEKRERDGGFFDNVKVVASKFKNVRICDGYRFIPTL